MRIAPLFLLLAFPAVACVPTPASYKMTVASMMSCNESDVTFSKPDMVDDNWVHATGCGKTVDAVCEATGPNSTGGRCIALPTTLEDMLRWELSGRGCAKPNIVVAPEFKTREDVREYNITGCKGSTVVQRWKCSKTSDSRKHELCDEVLR